MLGKSYYNTDVQKIDVPDDKVSWDISYPEYNPMYFDSKALIGKPWADPLIGEGKFAWNQMDKSQIPNINRKSFEGNYKINSEGYPLNPKGRTGIRGRGLLGHWGPNFAGDPIVTRWKRDESGSIIQNPLSKRPVLQLVVIQRRDNKMWALPGGMVDSGEDSAKTAIREFLEEATNSLKKSKESNDALRKKLDTLFSIGDNVYNDFVNDPRNTDNAWMETSAFNYHDDTGDVTNLIVFDAGDDAINTKWLDVDKNILLHASHLEFVHRVSVKKNSHW